MSLRFEEGLDPIFVEFVTRENMNEYYLSRDLKWDTSEFLRECTNYINFQVFRKTDQVASFSLSYYVDLCLIRDIQVSKVFRNQGIGTSCLEFILCHAKNNGFTGVGLKVFTENPAVNLYKRVGFFVDSQESGITKMVKSCMYTA